MGLNSFLNQIRKDIPSITTAELKIKIEANINALILDIREKDEIIEGMIPKALHVPKSILEIKIEEITADLSAPLILYCAGGIRSLLAAQSLKDMGYTNLTSVDGGFGQWKREGWIIVKPQALETKLKRKYIRQIILKEIGEQGQLKLSESKVAVIGAGGLGSPCLLYLAAAGVGNLRVIDFDSVEISNLHRQILHGEERVLSNKAKSAQLTLNRLNSDVEVVPIAERLSSSNVDRLIGNADLVIDGSDNFETRYVVNDFCVQKKIPLLFAGIFKFEGQLTYFDGKSGPCLRCLYPQEAPPELAPSCQDAGVLGAFVGSVGCLQAMEAIKFLANGHPSLKAGELLVFDGNQLTFQRLHYEISPTCPWHGSTALL